MKKQIILFFIVLVMALLVSACGSDKQVETITLYKMNSFSEADLDSKVKINDSDEIGVMKTAIKKAIKRPGISDVVDPDFTIEIGEDSYYLWIQEDSGNIMNVDDTHTLYTLQKQNVREVYGIVNRYYSIGE